MTGPRLAILTVLTVAMGAAPAVAQEPWPVSLELQLGPAWTLSDGSFRGNDPGIGAQVTLGVRIAQARSGHIVTTLSYGGQGTGPMTDVCILLPDGSCKPGLPSFEWISLLGGWERRSTSLRLLTGPAAVRTHGQWERVGFAWIGQADVFTGSAGHLALSASLRTTLVPAYSGNRFFLVSVGVGVRVR